MPAKKSPAKKVVKKTAAKKPAKAAKKPAKKTAPKKKVRRGGEDRGGLGIMLKNCGETYGGEGKLGWGRWGLGWIGGLGVPGGLRGSGLGFCLECSFGIYQSICG